MTVVWKTMGDGASRNWAQAVRTAAAWRALSQHMHLRQKKLSY